MFVASVEEYTILVSVSLELLISIQFVTESSVIPFRVMTASIYVLSVDSSVPLMICG